jgi:hemolysin activation/secretion protein
VSRSHTNVTGWKKQIHAFDPDAQIRVRKLRAVSCPPNLQCAGILLIWALLVPIANGARASSLDAGASTFESGARRYAPAKIRLEDIHVPHVEVASEAASPPVPEGPRFPIERFEVTGNTLLTPSQVDRELVPFVGTDRSLADVEKARDALQKRFETDGFLTIAVAIPQQTVESGVVRLDVTEARLGRIEVQNAGINWLGEKRVLARFQRTVPGAVLRQEDLQADVANANRSADARIRPQLAAGEQPGLVDVALVVDDRIPLHGSVSYDNNHTPGSPKTRMSAAVSYSDLWALGHEAGIYYQFVPTTSEFDQVQIYAGTYRMPMPFDERQQLFAYFAKSDTTNASATGGALSILGKGTNAGLRYLLPLPGSARFPELSHELSFGVDYKDVLNDVVADTATIETPITYMPFSVSWSGTRTGEQAISTAKAGVNFNFAGMIEGGSEDDFQTNRGGIAKSSPVTGTYQIVTLGVQHTERLPGILQTLAAGRFVDLPNPDKSFFEDWTFDLHAKGQIASQPLVATEQFGAGGVDTVRGYLDRENVGDNAYDLQLELRTPSFQGFLGGHLREHAQFVAFWDTAQLWLLADPTEESITSGRLESAGVGLRAAFLDHANAELFYGLPLIESDNTRRPRFHFRVEVGF